ncbi:hypothetical protein [Mycoplana ramosa]|uniref:Uncharacterized protein n=1 Tax=Mycoplana ramosa TaxID=40837 RepID=A0ABW3YYY8_MYCRA
MEESSNCIDCGDAAASASTTRSHTPKKDMLKFPIFEIERYLSK